MQLTEVYQKLGQDAFGQLIKEISIGKLRSYQIYEGFKVRAHLNKLNTETLRKATPRLWTRIAEGDEEFGKDIAQTILVSHLEMIAAVLNFLGVPNENGFFSKDLDPAQYLSDGWRERAYQEFHGKYSGAVLLFYLNHLGWELTKAEDVFLPATA